MRLPTDREPIWGAWLFDNLCLVILVASLTSASGISGSRVDRGHGEPATG